MNRSKTEIYNKILQLEEKRQEHLQYFKSYISSLAETKSNTVFIEVCSDCDTIDIQIRKLEEELKTLLKELKPKLVCYCGSLRVAGEAFKKAEYDSVLEGNIALLPCSMWVDIEREYGPDSDYKIKADELHKRKIDIADKIVILNVGGYIGSSTRSEIEYAQKLGKEIAYLEPIN